MAVSATCGCLRGPVYGVDVDARTCSVRLVRSFGVGLKDASRRYIRPQITITEIIVGRVQPVTMGRGASGRRQAQMASASTVDNNNMASRSLCENRDRSNAHRGSRSGGGASSFNVYSHLGQGAMSDPYAKEGLAIVAPNNFYGADRSPNNRCAS